MLPSGSEDSMEGPRDRHFALDRMLFLVGSCAGDQISNRDCRANGLPKTIIKASKSFVGEGWVKYDTCYRRKAAAMKSMKWSEVDFNLYNETFTGRARTVPRCKHCSSEDH